jgi:hypothetical protein
MSRTEPEAAIMDTLAIALCLSIGCCAGWTFGLYARDGVRLLLWYVPLGAAGAALAAFAIAWLAPWLGVTGLVIAGPACAFALILAGDAVIRAAGRRLAR